jgi:hypothetical protein
LTAQPRENEGISFRSRSKPIFIVLGIVFGLGGVLVVGMLILNDLRFLHLNDTLTLTWKQYLAIGIGFPLFYLFGCFVILSQPGIGSYRIDREGIEQTVFRQGPRYLRWEDVERLKWQRDLACIQGKSTSISILWTLVSSQDELRAKPFLEKILSADFDLSIKPVRRLSYMFIGLSIIVMTGLFFVLPHFLFAPRSLIVASVVLACCGLLIVFLRYEQQRSERINPTWRLRRKEERFS